KKHLDLVTNNKKYLRVKDIVKFLKRNNNLEMLMTNVDESKLDNQILGSVSHSKYFWNTGNNYFLYSAFFEFKKDVIPYKNVNKYISSCSSEYVYSKNYYKKLESMNESEIVKFLNDNPIEITDNCITSGKHRVFAMIGRLVREKDYVAFSGKIVSH
ncbi:hypothetical protein OA408_03205, partial [Acidimicrobiaceae bacterium]|nr:hypothetical protein [Acidimicrobiaceae bacterium]